jgi:hypothetical protein
MYASDSPIELTHLRRWRTTTVKYWQMGEMWPCGLGRGFDAHDPGTTTRNRQLITLTTARHLLTRQIQDGQRR